MALEQVDVVYQGSAFPLNEFPAAGQATFEGPTVCEVAPDGDLYIGNLQDSGWGGGRNPGSLVRMRPSGELPAGMAEIRAETDGFTIVFTQPVSREAVPERAVEIEKSKMQPRGRTHCEAGGLRISGAQIKGSFRLRRIWEVLFFLADRTEVGSIRVSVQQSLIEGKT